MFFMVCFLFLFFKWLLADLPFMEVFAEWLSRGLIFIIPDPEIGELVGKIAYAIFYPAFHYWASFVIAVYLTAKEYADYN